MIKYYKFQTINAKHLRLYSNKKSIQITIIEK